MMKMLAKILGAVTLTLMVFPAWSVNEEIVTTPLDASAAQEAEPSTPKVSGYVAKNESIQFLFNALSSESKRPYVLSKLAQKKTITGDFDISNPAKFLEKISGQIGLAWYDDGETIYVYDNTELKNAVVMLRNATLTTLYDFLQRTGLASGRYPIRGEPQNNAFYVAGPPAYVDIVVNAASYLDDLYRNVDLYKQRISIIKLHNTFVSDRTMNVRDQKITITGIGKVIETILANDRKELITLDTAPNFAQGSKDKADKSADSTEKKAVNETSQIRVIAYPETNSLLVKGTQEQIDLIQTLVDQLDIPKRHIELSLWIIDMSKNDLDKLGIDWQGAINIGSKAQVSLNTTGGTVTSTLDATKFLAQISALSQRGMAQVVSRPVILTQDNVPASFDNNHTFYTKLVGERTANLESVTYGTMINVLPRFSPRGDEVEMVLDIEDGQQQDANSDVNGIPTVIRTKLSTVARVPKDKSLLVGGYTLDSYNRTKNKIPLLGDLPYVGGAFRSDSETMTKSVRVFLIQPKLIELGASWNPQDFAAPPSLAPQLPLSETLKILKAYSETPYGQN
jgi:type III secretion protein C